MAANIKAARNKAGQVISIKEATSGLGYSCIGCNQCLKARKGHERDHHFAHHNAVCTVSEESFVHKLAKEILRTSRSMRLPIRGLEQLDYDEPEIEKSLGRIKPDGILRGETDVVCIEFCYQNRKTAKEIEIYRHLNLTAVEIELGHFGYDVNPIELEHWILQETKSKNVLHLRTVLEIKPARTAEEVVSVSPVNEFWKSVRELLLSPVGFGLFLLILYWFFGPRRSNYR